MMATLPGILGHLSCCIMFNFDSLALQHNKCAYTCAASPCCEWSAQTRMQTVLPVSVMTMPAFVVAVLLGLRPTTPCLQPGSHNHMCTCWLCNDVLHTSWRRFGNTATYDNAAYDSDIPVWGLMSAPVLGGANFIQI